MYPQTVAIWPTSLACSETRNETPYRLLDAKAGWLARAAWWLLGKSGALSPHYESVTTWTFVPHEQKSLHAAMSRAIEQVGDRYSPDKMVFVIGAREFQELTHSPAFNKYMVFYSQPFSVSDPYRSRRFEGVPIHVVPNMTGMALIPAVVIERPIR